MIKEKKENSFLRSAVGIYLSLAFFGLPLIVTDGYFNITETKSRFFYIVSIALIICTAVYGVFRAFSEKNKGFSLSEKLKKPSATDISLLIFAGFVLMSSALSSYQKDVWWGGSSRYQGAVTVLLYILVYFIVSRGYGNSQGFLFSAVAAFSLVCIIGVFNCFDIEILGFYDELPDNYKSAYVSTIGNINFYSSYICLLFPLVMCGFCQTKEKLSVIVYSFALVTGSLGMMVTSSESFVIGFVLSMVIIPLFLSGDVAKLKKYLLGTLTVVISSQIFNLIYSLSEEKNVEISELLSIFVRPYVAAVIAAVCISVYFLLDKKPDTVKVVKKIYIVFLCVGFTGTVICFALSNTVGIGSLDGYFKITEEWGTYRGLIWKQCIEAYSEFSFGEKLFGIGPEALYRVVETAEVFGERKLDQAHNEYLQYLLTTGTFGLLSYLSVILSITVTVVKRLRHNTLAIGAFAALVSYWVQAIVNIAQPFTTPIMYLYIALIGGMLLWENKKQQTDSAKTTKRGNGK